jgi:hypothetical protein
VFTETWVSSTVAWFSCTPGQNVTFEGAKSSSEKAFLLSRLHVLLFSCLPLSLLSADLKILATLVWVIAVRNWDYFPL